MRKRVVDITASGEYPQHVPSPLDSVAGLSVMSVRRFGTGAPVEVEMASAKAVRFPWLRVALVAIRLRRAFQGTTDLRVSR